MRLDKAIIEAGLASRRQIKKLIRSQQIRVDGQAIQKPGQIVDSHLQDIRVAGQKLLTAKESYFLLNKPAGVVSACSDANFQTVLDLLREEDRVDGLFPIGRLDRDTEGLVLLTNNGPLGFRMLHPQHHVDKTYYVEVNDALHADAPAFFENGVTFLDGTRCQPAQLTVLSSQKGHSKARVTISEGKFHQVKKMFLAYGVKVTYLKRISFGGFNLEDSLPAGAYRQLTEEEIPILKRYFD